MAGRRLSSAVTVSTSGAPESSSREAICSGGRAGSLAAIFSPIRALPVDWRGITRRGTTSTNYQVLPGDRVFVMGAPLVKVDSASSRVTAPLERILGTTLFGYTTVRTIETGGLGLGGLGGNGGGVTNVNVAR